MTALFYCAASEDIAPEFNVAARQVVRAAALRGYTIVSGGTTKGTMRVVCEEALACGAPTKGVLPCFMRDIAYPGLTETVFAPTMSERKELMREGADIVIALPGGIGTMDELFETLVLAKLGRFGGRIAALNTGGFYDPLDELLAHFVAGGFLLQKDRELLHLPRTVGELIALL